LLTLETITNRDEWNNALRGLPYAHVLQTWEWGEFKYETTGWYPYRWAFKRNNEIVAMASVGVRKVGFVSLMYAPKGPALDYTDTALTYEVMDLLKKQARKHRAIWLKVDPDIAQATGVPDGEDDEPQTAGQAVREILNNSGLNLITASSLAEAAEKAVASVA